MVDFRQPEDFAILVGIDLYPGLEDLRGAVNDVDAFGAWLVDPDGGGLNPDHVKKVCSPKQQPKPPVPGFDPIDAEFQELVDAGEKGGRTGRRLYIFLAGHGFAREPNLDARLLTAPARRSSTGYHIHGPKYAAWFQQAKYFDEIVLIMDCCQQDHQSAPGREPPWDPISGQRKHEVKVCFVFATKAFAASREFQLTADGLQTHRGVFTHALVRVLRTANGPLPASTLKGLVNNEIGLLYQANMNDLAAPRQEAEVYAPNGETLFFGSKKLPRVRFVPTARALNRNVVIRDGSSGRAVVHQEMSCTQEFTVDLSVGLYSVETDGWKEFVEVRAEETQSVQL